MHVQSIEDWEENKFEKWFLSRNRPYFVNFFYYVYNAPEICHKLLKNPISPLHHHKKGAKRNNNNVIEVCENILG